jgi:hypothetical protein
MRAVRYGIVLCGLAVAGLVACGHPERPPAVVPSPLATGTDRIPPAGPASALPSRAGARTVELPPITVTAGGGFAPTAWIWSISPDGSWTYQVTNHGLAPDEERRGHLTERQRRELAALATDPALQAELRVPRAPCDVTDGDNARTKVGTVERVASWCPEDLPNIARLRAWIRAATSGDQHTD